jgi:hypothetical protein
MHALHQRERTSIRTAKEDGHPMDLKPLQILQWNVGKRREAQLSLLNDQHTNQFDFLLLAEPFRFTLAGQNQPTVLKHHYWEAVLPTKWVQTAYQPFNF